MAPGTPDPSAHEGQPALPATVGRFRILKLLGTGGMGVVYQAHDPKKDRVVALKVLARDKASNPTLLHRFRSEALATRHLRHDNIVGVFEAGIVDGQFYIALEYVDGVDIAQLVQSRGRLPVPRSIDIIRQVTAALEHAFQQGIVHRDIKPSNLLIRRDGAVKLSDMGLARSTEDDEQSGITRAGTTVGTVDYIAPEQARDSKAADVRSDIYSLGCTWYHMLTGEAPYPDGTLTQKLKHHGSTPAPDPRLFNEQIHEDVVHVMARMLAKRPDQRFQSPTELLQALETLNPDRTEVSRDDIASLAEESPSEPRRSTSQSTPSVPPTPDAANTFRESENDPDPQPDTLSTPPPNPQPAPLQDAIPTSRVADITSQPTRTAPTSHQAQQPPPSHESRRPSRQSSRSTSNPRPGFDWRRLVPVGLMLVGVSALLGFVWFLRSLGLSMEAPTSNAGDPEFTKTQQTTSNNSPLDPTERNRVTTNKGEPGSSAQSRLAPPPVERVLCPKPTLRTGENRLLPEWVLRPPSQQLARLEVGGRGPHHYDRLDEALAALPAAGGLIRLNGPGPFFLRPTSLQEKAHVVIAPDTGRSLVVLRGDISDSANGLSIPGGSLRLERIDLVSADDQTQSVAHRSLFTLSSGNLSLHNCSVTYSAARQTDTVVLSVSGTARTRPSRVLFDHVFLRGPVSTIVDSSFGRIDLVLANSLLINGDGPALSLAVPGLRDSAATDNSSFLRIISTTLSSKAALLHLHTASEAPAACPLQVELVNSVLTNRTRDRAVLLDMGHWPQQDNPTPGKGRFLGLNWQTTASLVFGCRELIHLDPAVGPSILTFDEWQQAWPTTTDEATFQPERWPSAPDPSSADSIRPVLFDSETLKQAPVTTTSGEAPGCAAQSLPVPISTLRDRAIGLARRPTDIQAFPASSLDIRIRLKDHPDLGKYLATHTPENRTRLTVIGEGRHFTSPLRIENRTLQIHFQDMNDNPLVLVAHGSPKGQTPPPAMISVSQGHLLLRGGRFRLVATSNAPPARFLSVSDGSFTLEHCSVMSDARKKVAPPHVLIDWLTTSAPISQPASRIDSSFLLSHGTLIRADLSRRNLLVRDSLLVSQGTLFQLETASGDTGDTSSVEVHRSTLSSNRVFFSVLVPQTPSDPIDLFIEETVIAPGVDTSNGSRPTLLACPARAVRMSRITWWGRHNAFSSSLGSYLADLSRDGPSRRPAKRKRLLFDRIWGPAHRVAPLHGPRAILLGKPPAANQPTHPRHFLLHDRCPASTWAPGGSALGADVNTLSHQLGRIRPASSDSPTNF